jgi:hypothetical protein
LVVSVGLAVEDRCRWRAAEFHVEVKVIARLLARVQRDGEVLRRREHAELVTTLGVTGTERSRETVYRDGGIANLAERSAAGVVEVGAALGVDPGAIVVDIGVVGVIGLQAIFYVAARGDAGHYVPRAEIDE